MRGTKAVRLLLLDRDGTLNATCGRRPPNTPDELSLLPAVPETLQRYVDEGWQLVLVTNQAGIAFGYIDEQALETMHGRLEELLGLRFAAVYTCLQHPRARLARYRADPPCRKPRPGMLLQAMADLEARPEDCLMVGDREEDRAAARAAGVPFRWASEFFGWEHLDSAPAHLLE